MRGLFALTFACGFIGLTWSIKCPLNQIPCPIYAKCITYTWLCDNDNDCTDGTDQNFCTTDRVASREKYLKEKGLHIVNGALKCINPGYVYEGTREYCVDIDECLSSPCESFCTNTLGSYKCDCQTGFQLTDTNNCIDIDECAKSPCSDYCMNTNGSFHCLCQTGYKVQNVYNCTDVDECENNPCSHICTNYAGGFTCSCRNGYSLADDATTCIDIDECSNSSLSNCEQICNNNNGSFSCDCHTGYVLADNGTACNDIDECLEIPRVCSQTCVNNVGSYACECINGYVMSTKGPNSSCEVAEGNTKTLYATENKDIVLEITGTEDQFNLTRRAKGIIKRICYEASTRQVLWLETYSSGGAILSLRLGQDEPRILIKLDDGNPGDMAMDSVTNKLYVTDSELSAVVVYDAFESSRNTRLNITADLPSTIVLDSKDRFFYYVNLGERHLGIYKSGMDGDGSVPFVTSDVGRPTDIFLDQTTAVLYWADCLLDKIEMVSLDGKIRKILMSSSSNPSFKEPLSISVYEDNIYWSQRNSFDVYSTNKRNYNDAKKIASGTANVLKVLVSSSTHSGIVKGNNSCLLETCEQTCLLGPNDASKCVCYTGFKMNNDGSSCTSTGNDRINATVNGVKNQTNLEQEEKIDYESLKQTVEINLLRTLVEKTEDIVRQIEKLKIVKNSR